MAFEATLASLYAPNTHQDLIAKTLDLLLEFSRGQLILGDNFNTPVIPAKDTSLEGSSILPSSRKRIARAIHKAQLIDIWRISHPSEKDYTFYSLLHKQYSRIDYFLIPHSQLQFIQESSISSITWSDHSPILLSCSLTRSWRLNESLLQEAEVLEDVTREPECYFRTNDTPDSNTSIVWEAHKAVIRGVLIKHSSRIKKQRMLQLTSLLDDLRSEEARHKHASSPALETELLLLRKKIADLMHFKSKATI